MIIASKKLRTLDALLIFKSSFIPIFFLLKVLIFFFLLLSKKIYQNSKQTIHNTNCRFPQKQNRGSIHSFYVHKSFYNSSLTKKKKKKKKTSFIITSHNHFYNTYDRWMIWVKKKHTQNYKLVQSLNTSKRSILSSTFASLNYQSH